MKGHDHRVFPVCPLTPLVLAVIMQKGAGLLEEARPPISQKTH